MAFWKTWLPELIPFQRDAPESSAETDTLNAFEELQPPNQKIESIKPLLQHHEQKAEVERVPLNQINKVIADGRIRQPEVPETLLHSQNRYGPDEETYVHVVQEVLSREIMIALENIQQPRNIRSDADAKLIDKQRAAIESLRQEVRVISEGAKETQESLGLLLNQNHLLQKECRERKEKNSRLSQKFEELMAAHRVLGDEAKIWTRLADQWESRAVGHQEAKITAQARVLRAEQKAELAELRAKHAISQSEILDSRLKEAISSSETVCQRVEDLRKLQAGILRNMANQSPRSGRYTSESSTQFLGNSSKVFRQLRTLIPLPKSRDIVPAKDCERENEDPNEATHSKSMEGTDGNGVETETARMPKVVGFCRFLSLNNSKEQTSSSIPRTMHPLDPIARTLEALEANLGYLQEVVQAKQAEVDRLHGELQKAKVQSNKFERSLSEERHKVKVMEHTRALVGSKSCDLAKHVDAYLARHVDSYGDFSASNTDMFLPRRPKQIVSQRADRPCTIGVTLYGSLQNQ